jgi:hypothetical protein
LQATALGFGSTAHWELWECKKMQTGGIMDQGSGFQFVVDEQYENEKGVFTVLSIHKNEMVIRWESGEEIRTDIELQRNIQARRQREVIEKEIAAQKAKSSRSSATAKVTSTFEGFKETDFKNSASGTKWRGRKQLGGAVTSNLAGGKLRMNSWAFANKPEMHWLDTSHQKTASGENCAKFFVRVNTDEMLMGFSIGWAKDDTGSSKNWEAFSEWLENDGNQETLHTVALKNGLKIYDKYQSESPVLLPADVDWQIDSTQEKKTDSTLNEFIQSLSADGNVHLEIAKAIKKNAILDKGKEIAVEIAELFSQLLPLYKAAWVYHLK